MAIECCGVGVGGVPGGGGVGNISRGVVWARSIYSGTCVQLVMLSQNESRCLTASGPIRKAWNMLPQRPYGLVMASGIRTLLEASREPMRSLPLK